MEIKIYKEEEILRAVGTGSFTLQTAKQTFAELMIAVGEHKANKILFDARAVTGEPTVMERFQYAEFCALRVRDLGLSELLFTRFAYVMHFPLRDKGHFGETVAFNRGMRVKTMGSMEEAEEWLRLPQSH